MPGAPTLPALTETTRCSIIETDDVVGGRREILGEILALSEDDLGSALETLLRSLTVSAALSEAILETRAARVAPVRPASLETLQALSLDVRAAGFPVRFAPTWTPLEEGEIGLGIAGAERELRDFLAGHPSYRLAWGAVGSRAASGVLSRDMRPRHFSEE
ncbi:MAG TPA: hypothetical protein VIZ60_07305 [Rubrobacter sp.]